MTSNSPNGLRLTESPAGSRTWNPQGPGNACSRPCHIRGKQNAKSSECAQQKIKTQHSLPPPPPLSWVPPAFQAKPRLFLQFSSIRLYLLHSPTPYPNSYPIHILHLKYQYFSINSINLNFTFKFLKIKIFPIFADLCIHFSAITWFSNDSSHKSSVLVTFSNS